MTSSDNMQVKAKYYTVRINGQNVPRVDAEIGGYTMTFGCNAKLRPVAISTPHAINKWMQRPLFAHAAVLFKEHVPPQLPLPLRQPLAQH